MKHEALFSSKDKSKNNKSVICCDLKILCTDPRVKYRPLSKTTATVHWKGKSNAYDSLYASYYDSQTVSVFKNQCTCKSNTTICPPVLGDNPRALASGLSPVQVDKPWYNYSGLPLIIHLKIP